MENFRDFRNDFRKVNIWDNLKSLQNFQIFSIKIFIALKKISNLIFFLTLSDE